MSKQHYDETFGLKLPENCERYFVPAIGRPLAEDLIRHAALHPGERVLDVACGTGIVARLAAEQVGETGSVTGLDINPGMLAVARSISTPGVSIEWFEANAEFMPLQDETYNVVLCQMGLQFMEDKPAALKEMRRVLVPGGRLILNVPGPTGKVFSVLAESMKRHIGPEAAGFVTHEFSLHDTTEIQQLLSEAGFREIAVQANNKTLNLPAPKDFLWQYVHSTPLAGAVSKVNEEAHASLEKDVVEQWQNFNENGNLIYSQRIVVASARK